MMAWGYLLLHRATGNAEYWTKAVTCLHWLDVHRSPKFEKHSWANFFDFPAGAAHTPRTTASSCGPASSRRHSWKPSSSRRTSGFLTSLEAHATGSCRCRGRGPTAGRLPQLFHARQESIHNANMLGAAALARGSPPPGRQDYEDAARSAMRYSCLRMLPDGSWWYAEDDSVTGSITSIPAITSTA